MTPLTPQLIGQTEIALSGILKSVLTGRTLTEREWVVLRLTSQFEGVGELDGFLADRTGYVDMEALLAALRDRGLLAGSALSAEGAGLVADIGREIAALTEPIWESIDEQDAEAAGRALSGILEQARAILAAQPPRVTAHP